MIHGRMMILLMTLRPGKGLLRRRAAPSPMRNWKCLTTTVHTIECQSICQKIRDDRFAASFFASQIILNDLFNRNTQISIEYVHRRVIISVGFSGACSCRSPGDGPHPRACHRRLHPFAGSATVSRGSSGWSFPPGRNCTPRPAP
jgi:hypothetical protein